MARGAGLGRLGGRDPVRRIVSVSGASDARVLGLEEARAWIGRRLVLRRPLLGFAAGTRCAVMCVVDFGDGLLLWVRTDDRRLEDVDQLALEDLEEHFNVLPVENGRASSAPRDARVALESCVAPSQSIRGTTLAQGGDRILTATGPSR